MTEQVLENVLHELYLDYKQKMKSQYIWSPDESCYTTAVRHFLKSELFAKAIKTISRV